MSRAGGQTRASRQAEQARAEFPYEWEEDAAVSRRELLRLATLASAALFAGTLVLALLGRRDDRRRGEPQVIQGGLSIAPGEALYFHYPGSDDQAVLLRMESGEFVAYSQKCTHLSCSVYVNDDGSELICPCHDGKFNALTGEPTAGPPQRRLPRIRLEQRNGELIAVEEVP